MLGASEVEEPGDLGEPGAFFLVSAIGFVRSSVPDDAFYKEYEVVQELVHFPARHSTNS
jgi:hypothetical protein